MAGHRRQSGILLRGLLMALNTLYKHRIETTSISLGDDKKH